MLLAAGKMIAETLSGGEQQDRSKGAGQVLQLSFLMSWLDWQTPAAD
jgi:hypothetical protein